MQSNSFNVRGGQKVTERKQGSANRPPVVRKPDEKILEHQRKRAIEVKLAELEESLQEKGCAHSLCLAAAILGISSWAALN